LALCAYEFGASEEQRAQLTELGSLVAGCRDVFIAAFDDGMLTPRNGSQAEHDFAFRLSGPGGAMVVRAELRVQRSHGCGDKSFIGVGRHGVTVVERTAIVGRDGPAIDSGTR
jgi:hypothetical protein